MNRWQRLFYSLRWRLVASYLALALITLLLAGVLALLLIRRQMTQAERVAATDVACNVADAALPLYQEGADTQTLLNLAQQSASLYDMEIRFLDPEEQTVAVAQPPPLPQLVQLQSVTGTVTLEVVPGQPTGPAGSRLSEALVIAQPPRSDEVGYCLIAAAEAANRPLGFIATTGGRELVEPALGAAREGLVTAGAIAAVVALLLGLGASYRLTRPLTQLAETAAEMGQGNLAVRAPTYGRDEVGRLASEFNQMAQRVQESVATLESERDSSRRFMSDASHELRTPITALRSFNELLLEGAAEEPEVRDEFLAESAAQIDLMIWIVEHLLDLTRLDAGVAVLDLEPCRAVHLLEEATNPFTWRAEEASIRLQVNLPPPELTVQCDRARILLALSNLLENALKFTPAGGLIEVGAETKDDELRFWVRDTGQGIQPDQLSHIFERFYRADRIQAGSGLGLAIVKSVAEAHGGRVEVESVPGEGSEFALLLPA